MAIGEDRMKECNLCGRLTRNTMICDACHVDLKQQKETLKLVPTNYGLAQLEEKVRIAAGGKIND